MHRHNPSEDVTGTEENERILAAEWKKRNKKPRDFPPENNLPFDKKVSYF